MPCAAGLVVITGASAGVGRATALAFAREGWRVGLIARGEERLAAAKAEIENAGGTALVLPLDVADAAAIERAADRVEQELGPIDAWVNNAMATVFSPVAEMSADEYRRVTEVTYLGQVHGTLAALRRMRPRNRGTIVNVGSALAYRAIPLQSAYCAAKFAARGFTDALRSELIHDNSAIRLSMVHLPGMNTPQFEWARSKLPQRPQPVAPVYQPEVAARAIVRAAHEAPRELWVGRSTVQTVVGNMVAPDWLDTFLADKAWQGQMSGEPTTARPGNLFAPATGDFGAHGRFDARATRSAFALSPGAARKAIAGIGLGLAAAGLAYAAFRDGRRDSARRRVAHTG